MFSLAIRKEPTTFALLKGTTKSLRQYVIQGAGLESQEMTGTSERCSATIER
jgi:hypothetical protein